MDTFYGPLSVRIKGVWQYVFFFAHCTFDLWWDFLWNMSAVDVIWDHFVKSHYCLISESLLSLTCTFLFCQHCVIFRRKMQRGKFCLTRSVRKLNWLREITLVCATSMRRMARYSNSWNNIVVKINWKILCNVNVHYWLLQSLSTCALKRNMTVHDLCYGILTES